MKLIGLDVGEKRIGVAKIDTKSARIAVPYGVIYADGTEFNQLAHLISLHNIEGCVIGLPRNNSGQETAQSRYVRNFAKQLQTTIPNLKIAFEDESLTSVEAESRLKNRRPNPKTGEIDAEAATIILQDFVERFVMNTKTTANSSLTPFSEPLAPTPPNPSSTPTPTQTPSKKAKKGQKSFKLSILLIIILMLLGGGLGAIGYYNYSLTPIGCNQPSETDCPTSDFVIAEGESVNTIARHLADAKLIRNSLAFLISYRLNYSDHPLQTGDYELSPDSSVQQITEQFITGAAPKVFSFTFLPGETLADFKVKLQNQGYSASVIDAALAAPYTHPILASKPATSSLEGYLYGETYEFYQDESVENIITTMLDELWRVVQNNQLEDAFAAQGLTLHEGITLASVIQKESPAPEQPTVAQVFLSRLSIGLPLGSDVTVQYALDQADPDRTTYTNNTTALTIDSCYNTRLYPGLPCGPISNPSQSALLAVAHPSDTDYLYFLTGDDGMMYYSYTESEHNYNAYTHCQKLCNVSL